MISENTYPELATLKNTEIFVEGVRVVKGGKFSVISIEKVIKRSEWTDMARALKSILKADKVYLTIIENNKP
jgi:hypothetical protein